MKKEVLASILFVVGFILLIGPNVTGAVIGVSGVSFSCIGLVLMLVGSLMFADGGGDPGGLEEIAEEHKLKISGLKKIVTLLKNRQIPDKPRDYIKIAKKCGYDVRPGKRIGFAVYLPGTNIRIQTIKKHGIIERDIGRKMLRDLRDAKGKYSTGA